VSTAAASLAWASMKARGSPALMPPGASPVVAGLAETMKEPRATTVQPARAVTCDVPGTIGRSHSSSFDQRRRPETLRTAMATAFFWPSRTTRRLPRVIPVPWRLHDKPFATIAGWGPNLIHASSVPTSLLWRCRNNYVLSQFSHSDSLASPCE
jgi:hypothetical protein